VKFIAGSERKEYVHLKLGFVELDQYWSYV
jgi:hypothetical protein